MPNNISAIAYRLQEIIAQDNDETPEEAKLLFFPINSTEQKDVMRRLLINSRNPRPNHKSDAQRANLALLFFIDELIEMAPVL